MNGLQSLSRLAAGQGRDRLVTLGAAASLVWLALVAILAWAGGGEATAEAAGPSLGGWLLRALGVVLPLALIWFAVWSARSLALLRAEAEELRALLGQMRTSEPGDEPLPEMRTQPLAQSHSQAHSQPQPRPVPRPAAVPPRRPAAQPLAAQAPRPAETPPAPELTAAEVFMALNFPDGPDDHEAIRCLRLALSHPELARLIRAAQDVVTLLASRGIYMDDIQVPETDPALWRAFVHGARGEAVAGLAVVDDAQALAGAAEMMRADAVFRDVAQHFMRHFDRLLGQRAETDGDTVLAVLAETRSGRAFTLLGQITGVLGTPGPAPEAGGDQPAVS